MENTKLCAVCKETKPLIKFYTNPDGSIRKHVCMSCYAAKDRARIKLEMLEALGWECACCGEKHGKFLCLDHKDGSGAEHRAQYKSSNNTLVQKDAKAEGWPKDKYQLLCFNCNSAKNYFGECPHQIGESADDYIEDLNNKMFLTGKTLQSKENKGLKFGPAASASRFVRKNMATPQEQLQQLLKSLSPEDIQKLLAQIS